MDSLKHKTHQTHGGFPKAEVDKKYCKEKEHKSVVARNMKTTDVIPDKCGCIQALCKFKTQVAGKNDSPLFLLLQP